MRRTFPLALLLLVPLPSIAHAQTAKADKAAQIKSAMSAAPASVAEGAAVMDLENNVLREGTNGWVCLPDNPAVPNNVPVCVDEVWLEFIEALTNKRKPNVTKVGFSYMLQGDMPVSNKDPFATGPTADNQWIQAGPPHIMIVLPELSMLEGISSDPNNGGPWVMWKGTPYAHLMVPTVPRK